MFVRFIAGIIALALLLTGGILLFGNHIKNRALPEYEGEVRIEGIKNPIEIYRDSFAIAHISAETDEDAYYALGYIHAQERLFQMDFTRRIGKGLLSEVLGEKSLLIDKWARIIGFSRIAQWMWQQASLETKRYLISYSRGVNEFIRTHHGKFGMEFDALSYEPEQWQPVDCMIIGRLLSWEMNFSYWTDAAFSDLALYLDSAHLASLYPGYPPEAPTVLEGGGIYAQLESNETDTSKKNRNPGAPPKPKPYYHPENSFHPFHGDIDLNIRHDLSEFFRSEESLHSALQTIPGLCGLGGGSNAIGLTGRKTVSGGAMLENDLHLALGAPSRWYLVHLESKTGLNAAGFTVPGIPLLLSGRNRTLSWGITNGMIDECDYFILRADSSGSHYYTPYGIKPITTLIQHIPVRNFDGSGKRYERLVIRTTDNGPIVSDLHTFSLAKTFVSDKKTPVIPDSGTILGKFPMIALEWNGNFTSGDELGSFFAMHHAKTIDEGQRAVQNFATPCLNLMLAEAKTGQVAYQLIGRIPIRNGSEERAMLPRYAESAYDAWQGFSKNLPNMHDPFAGYIVSANNPPMRNRPIPYSENWEPPGRAQRLKQLIEYTKKIDRSAMERIMTDTASPFEKGELVPHILRIYRGATPDTTHKNDVLFSQALDYLENWDGVQGSEDISTTILNVFFLRLVTNTCYDELGVDGLAEFDYLNNVPFRTLGHLLREPENIWWDDARTSQYERRDDVIRHSFEEAIGYLRNKLGPDIRAWNWGKLHYLTYKHPFADESPEVAALGNIETGGAPGGMSTVIQASYTFWNPFSMRVGPSMRQVSDMKTDVLSAALPTGNSGNLFNPHYRDMVELFKKGELIDVPLVVKNPSWKKLVLLPE